MYLAIFSTCFVTISFTSQLLWKSISSTPGVYLDELCLELEEVSVVVITIGRTLVKGGYSMKKVQVIIISNLTKYVTNSKF